MSTPGRMYFLSNRVRWITGSNRVDRDEHLPPYLFRKKAVLHEIPQRASLYVTSLGCYRVRINGRLVSDRYFAPGFTQYDKRILFNCYDVTDLLASPEIEIISEVSSGWYTGRLGLCKGGNRFGKKRAFRMLLELEYPNSQREWIATDDSWQVTTDGPRRKASFFDGEVYDARRNCPENWQWKDATIYKGKLPAAIEEEDGVPVLRHEKLLPKCIWKSASGTTLIDFGKNIAGFIEIGPFEATAGTEITIRHGELIQKNKLFTENLRTAKAELHYVCRNGEQSYSPEFTYMGFQFAEVSGIEITEDNIAAWELYSDISPIGSFSCSDERINQLQANILTSLKANFIDIPTDCPQRDERCGWTGDIAVFAPTAVFNMDITAFMKKWLRDLSLSQRRSGVVPIIVPDNALGRHFGDGYFGWLIHSNDAVWGDAAVLVPWAVYQSTGDIDILLSQYHSMKAWVEYERRMSSLFSFGDYRYIWSHGFHFGDWLAPGSSMRENTKKAKWTSTAYFANSAKILGQVAEILGYSADAEKYTILFEKIRSAFQNVLIDPSGHIKGGFQSAYVLALQFGLLTAEQERLAVDDLVKDIRAKNMHLATGFVGTDKLPFALSDHGATDTAYALLMQESFPSWLYPVLCGATSIWERWDSLKPDGTVNTGGTGEGNMVSFNHYAYGAIGNWLYTRVGGLEMEKPGYQSFRLAPYPGGGLTSAKVSHICPYGKIESSWKIENEVFTIDYTVPEGTSATVYLPDGSIYCDGSGHFIRSCTMQ